ncbi:MAG: hypothetical protein M3Q97_06010, partial [Bacteroidota bacterium]|nr:hypothetical protein [Bacteroidota bacterium]
PQLFWARTIRRSPVAIFIISIFVNIGMWFERFVIIVTSLHRDFLPSSWAMYTPSAIEVGIFIGTFGLFFTLFLLFAKYLPVIAIAEVKSVFKLTRAGKPKEAIIGSGGQDYDPDKAFALVVSGQGTPLYLAPGHHGHENTNIDPLAQGGGEHQ